ncbi:hypothetical protein CCICO_10945 [Corynebacterium ciconiae DSM 44920]|uniref:hypothetical protein n=1 Tax=Corynebacterium ciconiae TaxID=227319 RepID=UPI00037D9495|nr:hypothetical protein [Corynebacterium ciconiae]WKD62184.1 hypothetical protein CCICO_10945 [Corynebacterium ciconiae DSM 44920]
MRYPTRRASRGFAADTDGSVTIEAALGLASLVLVFALTISGMVALASYLSAVDTAGAAARAAAIGERYEPARGKVDITSSNGVMEATAAMPSPFGSVHATARFPVEYTADAERGEH